MFNSVFSSLIDSHRKRLVVVTVFLLLFVVFCAVTRFNLEGPIAGIYLLKGEKGSLLELKDDILLGEYQRLICKVEFEALYARWRSEKDANKGKPYLKYQWHEKAGRGYLITFFPDGGKFLACFGRIDDDGNKPVKGLFVGGGLPHSHYEDAKLKMNETGVAFYNGKEWHHLWCTANEAIFSTADPGTRIPPGSWEFLGSRVIFASQYQLIIRSSHLVRLDNVPARVDRYLIYHAGDRFFTLVNRLTNIGNSPASYYYDYGDESNRAMALQWASRQIFPGQSEKMVLTIGMADNDPKTGFPRKPPVRLNRAELEFLKAQ